MLYHLKSFLTPVKSNTRRTYPDVEMFLFLSVKIFLIPLSSLNPI